MKMNVKIDGETFEVEILDLNARPVMTLVNGQRIEVYPEEVEVAASVQPAVVPTAPVAPRVQAPAPVAVGGAGTVLAPLPGVILSIAVREGAAVETGQELCVLEAMKMKNAIRSSRAGKIAAVRVGVGETVRHGQVLMEFEA